MLSFQVVLLILAVGIVFPVTASDNGLLFPLKPSSSTGPYDDQKCMDMATTQINVFSGKMLPTEGTDLLNLKSTQMQISRMNISPDFYPRASLINAYLYKLNQAGETYGTTKRLTDHPSTLGSPVYDQYSKARSYYNDAMEIWGDIKDLFPKAVPPTLPDPTLPIRGSKEVSVPSESIF
jgi:hypothetical protein